MTSGFRSRYVEPGLYLYIIRGSNPNFGQWIHVGVAECRMLLLGFFDSGLGLEKNRGKGMYSIVG